MKIGVIQISETGAEIARQLQTGYETEVIQRSAVGKRWHDFDAFVFIGAMGICVRTIAPYIEDKHADPAVVCIDSCGQHVISVLSGHVGGANELTRQLADRLGAHEVITTQSDNAGLWALDTLALRFGWGIVGYPCDMNDSIFAFVNREPTALLIEAEDEGTEFLEGTLPAHVTRIHDISELDAQRYRLVLIVSPYERTVPEGMLCVHYIPFVGVVGFGLAHHPEDYEDIYDQINRALTERGVLPCALRYCTIDVKRDEPFIRLLEEEKEIEVEFFTAEQLAAVEVPNPSDTVAKHVGTPSVCEAAAILGSGGGELIVPKMKGKNWTAALAIRGGLSPLPLPIKEGSKYLSTIDKNTTTVSPDDNHPCTQIDSAPSLIGRLGSLEKPLNVASAPQRGANSPFATEGKAGGESGLVEIVGAGPGDPDLVSVRGRKMLERADLILYAGSLVPKALTECHKPGAVVRSSADMTLEEQCALMKEHYEKGHFIVRLHTGDPCIFGAIQEQMAFFDREGMNYHITPGISSFLAAAAELRSQFTIPERTQTIILTRGEGRTPMPEREKLHLLARSQSTMCIFLSAAIVDDVQQQLLQEYPEDTPVAACYHLTWPDQKIYRGQLKDLAKIVRDNHLTLTTMLVVGEAIDNRRGLSELYNKNFTHLFRQGEKPLSPLPPEGEESRRVGRFIES